MKKLILVATLAVFVGAAALQALRILYNVGEPLELDYGEGLVIWQASQVFDLKTAFHPIESFPHMVFHYTPLYHIVLRGVTAVLGNALVSGRLISMAATFWMIGLMA